MRQPQSQLLRNITHSEESPQPRRFVELGASFIILSWLLWEWWSLEWTFQDVIKARVNCRSAFLFRLHKASQSNWEHKMREGCLGSKTECRSQLWRRGLLSIVIMLKGWWTSLSSKYELSHEACLLTYAFFILLQHGRTCEKNSFGKVFYKPCAVGKT